MHYIEEWADKRGYKQADIVRAIGANAGTVSRWFDGNMPRDEYLIPLAGFFGLDDPQSLLRHPDEDWLTRFFRERSEEERERVRRMLEAAFPRKVA